MASRHAHAPWRKAMLIPFWTLQMFFMLVMIALLALAVGILVSWKNNDDPADEWNRLQPGVSDNAINKASHMYLLLNSPGMFWADISAFQSDSCVDYHLCFMFSSHDH
jgi:hypothetical protein